MRALTMDEVGFVSGGYGEEPNVDGGGSNNPYGDIGIGLLSTIKSWFKGTKGTVIAGSGLAIGVSRDSDGALNLGVGFGIGVTLDNAALRDQTIQASLGIQKKNGKWEMGGSLLIWIGASTSAENQAYWDRAFGGG
jgi:hypothetical protein